MQAANIISQLYPPVTFFCFVLLFVADNFKIALLLMVLFNLLFLLNPLHFCNFLPVRLKTLWRTEVS